MSDYKKFYRSSTDKKIAGVCGGLGEYLEIDPTIIRIIFLVALLCFGSGFLIYLVIWLAAPEM
jgi:phage shock protein C